MMRPPGSGARRSNCWRGGISRGGWCRGGWERKTTGVLCLYIYIYIRIFFYLFCRGILHVKWHRVVGGGTTFFSPFIFLIIGLRRGSLSHFFLPSMSTYCTAHNSPLGHVPARILLCVHVYYIRTVCNSVQQRCHRIRQVPKLKYAYTSKPKLSGAICFLLRRLIIL